LATDIPCWGVNVRGACKLSVNLIRALPGHEVSIYFFWSGTENIPNHALRVAECDEAPPTIFY
jgi:hypothetical protein